jgi:hypothetical protein
MAGQFPAVAASLRCGCAKRRGSRHGVAVRIGRGGSCRRGDRAALQCTRDRPCFGTFVSEPVAADLNRDGKPDLATVDQASGAISVLSGNGMARSA